MSARSAHQRHPAIRRILLVLLLAGQGLAWAQPQASEHATAEGHYYLRDVSEVGAELMLRPNGRFEYAMAYGAVDHSARGAWNLKDDTVTLVSDKPPNPSFKWGEGSSELQGPFTPDGEKPTQMVVKVTSPQLGLSWSNIEVTAEFSNGQQRSGLTVRGGWLGFLDRTDGPWRDAVIRRVGVAYPKAGVSRVWFPVDPGLVKTAVIHFEPGSLIPPAFESMSLRVERLSGQVDALVWRVQDDSPRSWRFERR